MNIPIHVDDAFVDPTVSCSACDAVCCRLTVTIAPDDTIPRAFVERNAQGVEVMRHGDDGWCAALDRTRMCCSIYEQRPAICRKFAMGGAYCRDERARYADRKPA
ncbi:YkgJ family cysteine cluster protein [Dokdonella soli]|uniref:YkgJ family cysteine cluster protein n=1 Tax=Dokdonella soli TaxID=529810 RepID=A0ABP3TMH3_9GAMM